MKLPKPAIALILLSLAAIAGVWWLFCGPATGGPGIPGVFAGSLPPACQQVMLVLVPDDRTAIAQLWLMERAPAKAWRTVSGPIAVTIGHKGLAWGRGEYTGPPPPGIRMKHEGDLCSPAGIFRIPMAFGLHPAAEASWIKIPYTPLTPSIVGVDDPKSSHYNQIVDRTQVLRDWESDEPMARHTHAYQWGAFIGHNPERLPGEGSCIFLHLWGGPGSGTAGCTAMAEDKLKQVLAWLDPAKEPRIVQGLSGW